MENKLLTGSINISKLNELYKQGNKAFSVAKNGDVYIKINIWLNEEPNQWGKYGSIQTNFKDAKKEERHYIGNFELFKAQETKQEMFPQLNSQIPNKENSDLPF